MTERSDPLRELLLLFRRSVDCEAWSTVLAAERSREPGPATQLAEMDDQSAVAVEHIAQGPLAIAIGSQLGQRIARRNSTIFCAPAGWARTATITAQFESRIQRAPIYPGLTT